MQQPCLQFLPTFVGSVAVTIPPLDVSDAEGTFSFNPLPVGISSPVNVERLAFLLRDHPDPDIVSYVISGFSEGFDIGFTGAISDSRPRNLLSALRNAPAVSAAIAKELSWGHTSGPFCFPPLAPFHCSPLGVVPKKDGTFRIILDL